MRGVVYVVAKAPRPGESKTRLCPPLTPEQAAHLAGAFVLDVVDNVLAAGLDARLICRSDAERVALERLTGGRVRAQTQHGVGLGDALETAFRYGVEDGFDGVAVLGADSPTVPAETLQKGFDLLSEGADVTLGPSEDGGYYFLAATEVHPTLFRDMTWSTDRVCAETVARSAAAGLRTHLLPRWYDVDDAASLARLRRHLRELPTSVARHTRAAMANLTQHLTPITQHP